MIAPPELVRIADHRLEVQQIRVEHPRHSIALLHEALGSISHWRDFPQRLSEQCEADVLVYSRLGHGNSDGPPKPRTRPYFEHQALTILPALLAHFGIEHPVLLGHSEGAAMGLLYAAMHPQQVRAVILESPILELEPVAAHGMAVAEIAWRETDFRERLGRHHRDPDAVFAAWLSIRDSDGLFLQPLEAHLPPLSCPVLMLQGERDEYGTPRQAEVLRPLAPQMEWLLLPATGHTPHRERPEVVLDAMASFLAPLQN